MSETEKSADQLMCEHEWVPPVQAGHQPRCGSCGLVYDEYVEGTVRAALSRMGVWD